VKTQVKYLFALACVNIAIIIIMSTRSSTGTYVFPGVNYSRPLNASGSASEYMERYNATETVEAWESTPFSGIPIIGDIFSGLSLFYNQFRFLAEGFSPLLNWFTSFLPVDTTVLTVLCGGLVALHWIMVCTLIIEFVSGRQLID